MASIRFDIPKARALLAAEVWAGRGPAPQQTAKWLTHQVNERFPDGFDIGQVPTAWSAPRPQHLQVTDLAADLAVTPAELLQTVNTLMALQPFSSSLQQLRAALEQQPSAWEGAAGLTNALHVLERPIHQQFRHVNDDMGGASQLRNSQAKTISNALDRVQQELDQTPLSAAQSAWINSPIGKAKYAYWTTFFIATELQGKELRQMCGLNDNAPASANVKALETMERHLGPEATASAFKALQTGDQSYFLEHVISVYAPRLELITDMRYSGKIKNPQIYANLHYWIHTPRDTPQYILQLTHDLADRNALDFPSAFAASLPNYFGVNLSSLPYDGTLGHTTDEWLTAAQKRLGTAAFLDILKNSILSERYYPADKIGTATEKQAYFLTSPVSQFQQNALLWSVLFAPADVKAAMVDFVVDTAAQGKVWVKPKSDRLGRVLAKATQSVLANTNLPESQQRALQEVKDWAARHQQAQPTNTVSTPSKGMNGLLVRLGWVKAEQQPAPQRETTPEAALQHIAPLLGLLAGEIASQLRYPSMVLAQLKKAGLISAQ